MLPASQMIQSHLVKASSMLTAHYSCSLLKQEWKFFLAIIAAHRRDIEAWLNETPVWKWIWAKEERLGLAWMTKSLPQQEESNNQLDHLLNFLTSLLFCDWQQPSLSFVTCSSGVERGPDCPVVVVVLPRVGSSSTCPAAANADKLRPLYIHTSWAFDSLFSNDQAFKMIIVIA